MPTSARSRRREWLLGGAVVAVVLIIGSFAVFAAATTTSVSVRNDGTEPLRMSGCSIDDALDLRPGDTGSIDVPQGDREGCSVYDHDGSRYLGCFTVTGMNSGIVAVRRSLNAHTSESACERIG